MPRRVALGIALGALCLLALDALAARSGIVAGAMPKLAGPSPWITSRAAGVTAYVALTLDVVFGLLVSTGAADAVILRARSVAMHRWLSTVALAMAGVHALALLGDGFVRFDVLDLLIPFASSYRSLAVALGVLAAYGALLVHASFGWRRQMGAKAWRKLHYTSFFVFAAALLHGVFAGSDSSTAGMHTLYAGSATLVGALAAYRVCRSRDSRCAAANRSRRTV